MASVCVSSSDACSSRSLSWLVKPCRPDPRRAIAHPSPEFRPSSAPTAVAPCPPILSLPDDLLLECLARAPPASLRILPLVCRRFAVILASPSFLRLRRPYPVLFALSLSPASGLLVSASLPFYPPSDSSDSSPSWTLSSSPVPLHLLDATFSISHARVVSLGRSVYIIGRGATLRYDALTGAVAPRAPTLYPRKKFAAAAVGGRIYVAGGAARTSAFEEYDPTADAWRVVGDAPRRRYGCVGASVAGVFCVAGGLRVGGADDGRLDSHLCAGTMDAYHLGAGAWVRGRTGAAGAAAVVPGGGCVVGACGVGSHVYLLASHAVEVSFWRWEGSGARGRRVAGVIGGEWTRLQAPPVPAMAGIGGGGAVVRFSCTAVGEDKVVALVHVSAGSGGGDGRRTDAATAALEGAVLVYDVPGGEWTRGPDLPAGLRRAALVCVEC